MKAFQYIMIVLEHTEIFFLFFPRENRIWHFMQIASTGDNLHEMSYPVFWEKQEKYYQSQIC